jgi:hypothetical protein
MEYKIDERCSITYKVIEFTEEQWTELLNYVEAIYGKKEESNIDSEFVLNAFKDLL